MTLSLDFQGQMLKYQYLRNMTLSLDFQGQMLKYQYLRNGGGGGGGGVNKESDASRLHIGSTMWTWPLTPTRDLDLGFWSLILNRISGMEESIMNKKRCEPIGC